MQHESSYLTRVRDFHERNGHIINLNYKPDQPAGVRLQRERLIMEELGELTCAYHEGNLVETADAMGDLLYVVVGTAVVYGVHIAEDWLASVENANRTSKSPSLALHEHGVTYIYRLSMMAANLFGAMESQSSIGHQVYLFISEIFYFAGACGIPLDRVFTTVHESNMSKNLIKGDGVMKYGQDAAKVKGEGYFPPKIREALGLSSSTPAAR